MSALRFFAVTGSAQVEEVLRMQVLGEWNESFGFGQENLPQLQDHPPQGCGARDLHRPAP